jgi:farnesyl diphosphate synthase
LILGMNAKMQFEDRLAKTARRVEDELQRLLSGERVSAAPVQLVEAIRHAVLGGGKRLRPFLVLESAALFDVPAKRALPAALAVELIHGYSLVHDDLPAMDNDTMRRGRPTVWTKYNEWTAILAGDALQSLAFEVLADCHAGADPAVSVELMTQLSRASGVNGMVGGQALDLEADKQGQPETPDTSHVSRLQAMKTGALIRFSCEAGAIFANASASSRSSLSDFGRHLGYAFQIADDLLDAEGDEQRVGKALAKDAAAGKATLVSLLGAEAAKAELRGTVENAKAALVSFGAKAEALAAAAEFVAYRDK